MKNQTSTIEKNMFGGSLHHPAYDKRPLTEREVLSGPLLYTIVATGRKGDGKLKIRYECIDGEQGTIVTLSSVPPQVRHRIKKLR